MDELIGRKVPWSPEAEQAVLGSCLIDARCIHDVIGVLKEQDFYLETNRDIFATIVYMSTNGQVIAVSEGYKAKASCLNGIESVKKNAADGKIEKAY